MKLKLHRRVFVFLLSIISAICAYAAIPPGYYHWAKGDKGEILKSTLREIAAPTMVLSYGGGAGATWEGFYKTDRLSNDVVDDMYSSEVRYFDGFSAVSGMNIEHSLPKSWWGGIVNYAYKDLFHLYPSDDKTNNIKSNLPLGIVDANPTFDNGVSKVGKNVYETSYTGNCFEPSDEYKGDFARSYFYISTMYEELSKSWNSPMMDNNTYPVWKPWALNLLMEWHKNDPVSEKELARNEAIYQIQNNRNPFIDYPDLVDYIWGDKTTIAYPFPEETEPFLYYPRQGEALRFDVIMNNSSLTNYITINATNLTDGLTLSLKKNEFFSLSRDYIQVIEAERPIMIEVYFKPTEAGLAEDTLVIASENMESVLVPISGLATAEFIVTEATNLRPVGGDLNWTFFNEPSDYLLSLYEGDLAAGDILFSAYVEGSSYNKAVEIYNGTGATVDLSKYSIRRQSNGAGAFINDTPLEGTLENGNTFVIVHSLCTLDALKNKANMETTDAMNFNGNDAIALYRNGMMIDMIGVVNDAANWGLDQTFERKASITHPTTRFDKSEWDIFANNYIDNIGSHTMTLATSSKYWLEDFSTHSVSGFTANFLLPDNYYTYSVTAVTSTGRIKSANTMQIRTVALEAPEVFEATHVSNTSFVAHWESNPYIEDHLFSLYRITGGGNTTEHFDFNTVGSSGKPAPEGWMSTASGNYTSTASSGISPNSIALKTDGEYIQTNEFNAPITKMSFMYRYPSAGAGSILTLEANCNGQWETVATYPYVNTTKAYPEFTFAAEKNVRAFKWSYKKVSGNMAIDDIAITFGISDTTYVEKNVPVQGVQYTANNLTPLTTYYYNTRIAKDGYLSPISKSMKITTTEHGTGVDDTLQGLGVVIRTTHMGVEIEGVIPGSIINVYNTEGKQLLKIQAKNNNLQLPLTESGIYLLKINDEKTVYKVMKQ